MKSTADALRDLGYPVSEHVLVLNVVRGLPSSYEALRTLITHQRPPPTFPTLLHFFAWVSTQFGLTVKAVQCDNCREFDNSTSRSFFLSRGGFGPRTMSCALF
jgi:hypothetical protein